MIRWWQGLSFKSQAFVVATGAICAAISLHEFLIEPILEKNRLSVAGGIDWYETPFWIAVAFLFGFGMATLFSYAIRHRLTRFARATEEMVRGNFSFRIQTRESDGDIFAKLSGRFNYMAETIERLVGDERRLLAEISHELRSPLARASAVIDVLTLKSRDDAVRPYLEKAGREIAHMNDLVGTLLQHGSIRLALFTKWEMVDLSAVAAELVESFAIMGATQKKKVRGDIAPGVRVEANPMQIHLIIENLLGNALFFTPEETCVEVRVSVQEDKALLRVRDYGSGVPTEHMDAVFRPFFRVEDPSIGHGGGIGLGLSLVREACEALNGTIEIMNVRPGLEATVVIPLSRVC